MSYEDKKTPDLGLGFLSTIALLYLALISASSIDLSELEARFAEAEAALMAAKAADDATPNGAWMSNEGLRKERSVLDLRLDRSARESAFAALQAAKGLK